MWRVIEFQARLNYIYIYTHTHAHTHTHDLRYNYLISIDIPVLKFMRSMFINMPRLK